MYVCIENYMYNHIHNVYMSYIDFLIFLITSHTSMKYFIIIRKNVSDGEMEDTDRRKNIMSKAGKV